jgi:hypothetical protein
MDDWQVGDLALCVTIEFPGLLPSRILKVGKVYAVTSVRWSHGSQCTAIGLAEARSRNRGDWHSALFRKIRPLSDDERDSFLADLDTNLPPAVASPATCQPESASAPNREALSGFGFTHVHEASDV